MFIEQLSVSPVTSFKKALENIHHEIDSDYGGKQGVTIVSVSHSITHDSTAGFYYASAIVVYDGDEE